MSKRWKALKNRLLAGTIALSMLVTFAWPTVPVYAVGEATESIMEKKAGAAADEGRQAEEVTPESENAEANGWNVWAETATQYVAPKEMATVKTCYQTDSPGNVSFAWYMLKKNKWGAVTERTLIEGATEASYSFEVLGKTELECVFTQVAYQKSVYFTVYVDNQFVITPVNDYILVPKGQSATMEVSVSAIEKDKLEYAWYDSYQYDMSDQDNILGREASLTVGNVTAKKTYYCVVSDGYGNMSSTKFDVGVDNHFSLRASEESTRLTVKAGSITKLEVIAEADDKEGMTFEWRSYGVSLQDEDENGSVLSYIFMGSRTVDCIAKDRYGNDRSVSYTIIVENNITASAVCSSYIVSPGETVTMEVEVTADALDGLCYQWFDPDGNAIDGATSDKLVVNAEKNGSYSCRITDDYTTYDKKIYFSIQIENHFKVSVAQSSVKVSPGNRARLEVNVSGDDVSGITCNWGCDAHGKIYTGIEENNPLVVEVEADKKSNVHASVWDKYGNWRQIFITVYVENHFTAVTELQSYETGIDIPIELRVITSADNTDGMQFQWYKDNNVITGETGDSIEVSHNVSDTYKYWCKVTDVYSNEIDVYFMVKVSYRFKVTQEKTEYSVAPGDEVTMSVSVETDHEDTVQYQWYRTDSFTEQRVMIEGATDDSLTIIAKKNETYACEVQETKYNGKDIKYFTIQLYNNFSAKAVEEEVTVKLNENATLAVEVSGENTQEVTYAWYDWSDGTLIPNETGATYQFNATGDKSYYCVVNDGFGTSETIYFWVKVTNDLKVTAVNPEISTDIGAKTRFEVTVSAIDADGVTYYWRNQNSPNIMATTSVPYAELTIMESGRYECKAVDKYGESSIAVFIVTADNHFTVTPSVSTITLKPKEKGTIDLIIGGKDLRYVSYRWSVYYDGAFHNLDVTGDEIEVVGGERKQLVYYYNVSDGLGSNQSGYVSVNTNNAFSAKPDLGTRSVPVNETSKLNVITSGYVLDAVSYQWYAFDGTYQLLEGENMSYLEVPANGKNYRCDVNDGYGTASTVYFRVNPENHLTASALTSSLTVPYGEKVTLTTVASADEPSSIRYEWKMYDDELGQTIVCEGATEASYTFTAKKTVTYTCFVTDTYGSTTAYAYFSVRIENNLNVSVGEQEISVQPGKKAKITATVTGNDLEGLQYFWEYTNNYPYGDYYAVEGASGNEIECGLGYYRCRVRDRFGNIAYTLFHVYVENHLSAWMDKTQYVVSPGESLNLRVNVSVDDDTNLTYTWEKGNVTLDNYGVSVYYWSPTAIPGANGPSLNLTNVNSYCGYRCCVDDGYGNVVYASCLIRVENHLKAKPVQSEVWVPADAAATLEVIASADDASKLSYSWYVKEKTGYNMTQIPGANGAIYQPPTPVQYGEYQCRVHDQYNNYVYVSFTVGVENHFTAKEASQVVGVAKGKKATLKVDVMADDLTKIYYVWTDAAGTVVSEGYDLKTYKTQAVTKATKYNCKVSDPYGRMFDLSFTVTVKNNLKLETADGNSKVTVPFNGSKTIRMKVSGDDLDDVKVKCYYFGNPATIYEDCTAPDENGIFTFQIKKLDRYRYYYVTVEDKYGYSVQCTLTAEVDSGIAASPVMENGYESDEDGNVVIRVRKGKDLTLNTTITVNEGLTYHTYWYRYEKLDGENKYGDSVMIEEGGTQVTLKNVQEDLKVAFNLTDQYNTQRSVMFLIEVMEDPAIVWSASASFAGTIDLGFYCEIPDDLLRDEGTYVTLTKGTQVKKVFVKDVKQTKLSGHPVRKFAYPIVAKEMRDKVILRVYDGNGNEIPLESGSGKDYRQTGCSFSVADYCDLVKANSTDEKMIALAKAVKDYGTAAQLYFGYNATGLSVSSRITNLDKQVVIDAFSAVKTGTRPAGIAGNSFSFVLEADSTIRMYYNYEEGVGAGRFGYQVDEKKATIIRTKSGKCYLEVTGIAAKDLDTVHSFKVILGNKSETIQVSGLTYASMLCSQTKNKPINLGKAMYLYNQAAKAYFKK